MRPLRSISQLSPTPFLLEHIGHVSATLPSYVPTVSSILLNNTSALRYLEPLRALYVPSGSGGFPSVVVTGLSCWRLAGTTVRFAAPDW